MNLSELFLIAIGLSMDAFAVSICIGLSLQTVSLEKSLIVGLYFGTFQAVMPLIVYFFGFQPADKIAAFDHRIDFILLGFIGIITLLFSMAGVKIGNVFGSKYKSGAELIGGIILILMVLKIILEHTGILVI
ncbi:hypothetical protein EQM13_06290 [Acidilutibacter cellobiosedens]|uniref:Manganese efflux pump MntP n=1 Tax=Acidilutibacter cellobiosedens TaxID=2507161 RepID=A0A410QB24_9FIRM|nr:manganese efflux pump [Acidilutibacter cellobiosedens]QAT61222.1 hypothetical protein EQM13_06290 [Acidilutibacter cellobiosedens]